MFDREELEEENNDQWEKEGSEVLGAVNSYYMQGVFAGEGREQHDLVEYLFEKGGRTKNT